MPYAWSIHGLLMDALTRGKSRGVRAIFRLAELGIKRTPIADVIMTTPRMLCSIIRSAVSPGLQHILICVVQNCYPKRSMAESTTRASALGE
jgi:hypothetical protein